MWPFRRRRAADEMAVETLLARANQASPPSVVFSGATGRFTMQVEDTFSIARRGLVATGRVQEGSLSTGTELRIVRAGQVVGTAKVTGLEQFRSRVDTATVGQTVGVLLDGVGTGSVLRGDVLTA